VDFVSATMGAKQFQKYGHEAMTKLMERIKPELLGSVNRTYRRSRLLIEKMRGLTKSKYSTQEMNALIDYLTVAYFSHNHSISRNELINDLKLKVVLAETLKIEELIWDLYEDYAVEFRSRDVFDIQREFYQATTNPVTIPLKCKYLESRGRTDAYTQTMVLQGAGVPNFNFNVPPNLQVPQQMLTQIFAIFLQQLNSQLKPFQAAKKVASYGEWKTE
jgi:hypothetical protein